MGTAIRAFTQEFNRYLISLRRSFIWLLGLIVFVALGIYYFNLRLGMVGFNSLPHSVYPFSFLTTLYRIGFYQIILLLSALLISEDAENGVWGITKSLRLPKFPILFAKFVWILAYSIMGMLLSLAVFYLYLFTFYVPFNISYVFAGIWVILALLLITGLMAMQGLFISSLFSKRLTAVLVAIAFYAFVTQISVGYYNNMFLASTPAYIFNVQMPVLYKFVILLDPVYFKSLSATILGISSIGMGNNNNGFGSSSTVGFYVPSMFGSPVGYVEIYLIQFALLGILIYLVIILRGRFI